MSTATTSPSTLDNQAISDMTEKVGGVAPDQMEGEPRAVRFMHSTWSTDPAVYNSTPLHRLGYFLAYKGPEYPRDGKLPVHSNWDQHLYVFPRALVPMAAEFVSIKYFNFSWPFWMAFLVYMTYFIVFAFMMIGQMNKLGEKYGFLDGQVARDRVPDARFTSTTVGLMLTVMIRPLLGCFVAYNQFETPFLSPWLPVHMFMYTTILDFWFYVYHRAMHEIDFLWKFHKTHHMTKHPNPLLSAFADPEQDFFDILIIPLMTYLTYPVDFYTWWICTVYILYVEAAGHSGLRMFWQAPIGGPILKYFDMDLALEDHDLHHRNGWRKSSNYGKQTRVWDKLFGTTRSRIEFAEENIEWDVTVNLN